MKLEQYLQELQTERNLIPPTTKNYYHALKLYQETQNKTIQELLNEAETEEEQGIRWKNRKLKTRLTQYQNHLLQNHNISTVKRYMGCIKSFYRHHSIEIHDIPKINKNNANISKPIMYQDLPTKEELKQAYNLANQVMKAYLLLAISSGCAIREILNLKLNDYYDWIKPYTPKQVIDREVDIVPIINLRRQKTNKYYYTFATPEAIREISIYVTNRHDDDNRLFKISEKQIHRNFNRINDELQLPRINNTRRIRTHMLRKFHASQLHSGKYSLSLDEIDSLQGRSKDIVRQTYFIDNPNDLREKYIRNIDQVTILDDVHTITVDSPEVMELRKKADKIDELEKLVQEILKKNKES